MALNCFVELETDFQGAKGGGDVKRKETVERFAYWAIGDSRCHFHGNEGASR